MSARVLESHRHAPASFAGRVEVWTVDAPRLADNPLGDPRIRELPVYLPPGEPADRPPVLFVLAGFTGRGQAYLETHPWRPGLVAKVDAAMARGDVAPAILVLPDAFTRLGGSQYVNSSAVGPYEDYVLEDLVPLVDQRLGPGPRGVLGKSSGGFGALRFGMRHPQVFPAVDCLSGDCGFDMLFPPEFLACLRGLVSYDSNPQAFLTSFFARPDLAGDGHAVINVLAMAACYSPEPASPLGFDLPFDLETGELVQHVWQRWLEFDPLRAVEHHQAALRSLSLLHLECGLADEFHLQWGARRLHRRLLELGIPHSHEEHAGGHRGLDERMVLAIDRLARHLATVPPAR